MNLFNCRESLASSLSSYLLETVTTSRSPHIHRDMIESIHNGSHLHSPHPIYKCCKFSSSLSFPSRTLLPCWGIPSQLATVPLGTFSTAIRPGSQPQPEEEPKQFVEAS